METSMQTLQENLDFVWLIFAGILVFSMQAGFTLVEAGLTRAKHSISVAMKNVADIMVAVLLFSLVGFPIMFGDTVGGWFGSSGFFLSGWDGDPWNWAMMFFQIVFAGTAATIVSGAIAERARLFAYLVGTAVVTVVIYPVVGHWVWGDVLNPDQQGWLDELGFMDFAGSTVVHSVGGWVALAAAIAIGPRIGKYEPNGKSNRFSASNLVLAALGVFLLWFGWFGFNAGSTTLASPDIALITLNTALGGAAGGFLAMAASWIVDRRPRAEDMLNGILGGLVSVTAGCNVFTPLHSLLAGAIGGLLVVAAIRFIDQVLKVDDAVGAIGVHGVCGAWGTLAVGIFGEADKLAAGSRWEQIGVQALGAGVVFVWAFVLGFVVYWLLKKTIRLRVGREDELIGLNISEHGARTSLLDTVRAMNEIASEKIDLTRKLEIEPGDDTEELNRSFNYLLDKIGQLVDQVKGQTGFVHSSSEQMMKLSRQLNDNSNLQDESVRQAYDYFQQMQARMKSEMETDREALAAFEQSIAIMNGISQDMRSTREQMNEMAANIGTMEAGLAEAGEAMRRLSEAMSEISASSGRSESVIATIDDISKQIGLLALNAGIEAARAGQYGQGFAVVAQEVKKLSGETQLSTQNIRELMLRMGAAVVSGRESSAHFRQTFEYLNEELSRIPEKVKRTASEIESMYQKARGFTDEVEELQANASAMKDARRRQYDELEAMMNRMRRVLDQIEENRAFTSQIGDRVLELRGQSGTLDLTMQKFKTKPELIH